MPRPKRINIANGWYHVFNRGISRKTICFTEFHFLVFYQLLQEIKQIYKVEIHSYCMMKNHFHLLLHTPEPVLSEAMWFLGLKFSTQVNRDIHGDGPLFRSRFRSILIQDDRYLLQVSRYIHLNPVEANLSELPETYRWSSCFEFLHPCKVSKKSVVTTSKLLSFFRSHEEYRDFLNLGNSVKLSQFYSRKNTPSLLSEDTLF